MRRRDFFSLVGGAAVAAVPSFARTEQAKVYRLAVVHPSHPLSDLTETGSRRDLRAFFQRLRQLGYVEGQNLSVERYSGEGRTERFAELVREVLRGNPDLIFAMSSRLTRDFKAFTHTIPVVAIVADPVTFGLVSSLARPGGNIIGTTTDGGAEIWGKRVQLLRELVPTASKVAFLASLRVWEFEALHEATERMGFSLVEQVLHAPLQEAEYRRVFAAMTEAGTDALIVNDQAEHFTNRRLIVELAEKARLPTIYPSHDFTEVDGLMAYGANLPDLMRHAADQIDMIFKGAKAGDIPFYQPTKFELAINLKTAKALGIEVSPDLLTQADEVVE